MPRIIKITDIKFYNPPTMTHNDEFTICYVIFGTWLLSFEASLRTSLTAPLNRNYEYNDNNKLLFTLKCILKFFNLQQQCHHQ